MGRSGLGVARRWMGSIVLLLVTAVANFASSGAGKPSTEKIKSLAKSLEGLDVENVKSNMKKAFAMMRETYDAEAVQFSTTLQDKLTREPQVNRTTLFLVLVGFIMIGTIVMYLVISRRKKVEEKKQR